MNRAPTVDQPQCIETTVAAHPNTTTNTRYQPRLNLDIYDLTNH
jgi:hypothetical protein